MNYDITFCASPCDNLSRFRHVNNLPKSTSVSIANLYATEYCPNILIEDFYTAVSSQIDELKNLRDMGINLRSTLCSGTRLKAFQSYYGKTTWIKTPYCPQCGAIMEA